MLPRGGLNVNLNRGAGFAYPVGRTRSIERRAWLRELHRVTRPGGVLVLTTHGAYAYGVLSRADRRVLDTDGFIFKSDVSGRLKLDGLPDFYQTAFHSRAYVERRWAELFRVLAYHERGLAGFQDVVVLERPA